MTRPYLVFCTIPHRYKDGTEFSHPCIVAVDGESEENAMVNARSALRRSFPRTPDDGFVGMKAELLGGES